jgi:hypothetical protein
MSNSNTPVSVIHLLIDKCTEALHRVDKYGQLALHKASSNRRIDTDIIDLLIQSFPGGACMKDNTGYMWFRGQIVLSNILIFCFCCYLFFPSSLPLHIAVAKETPSFTVVHALIEAYPRGLVELDNAGRRPYDKYGELSFEL